MINFCQGSLSLPLCSWHHRRMKWGSKGLEDRHRPPALRAGHPCNIHKAVSGVAHPQDVEGSGMAGLDDTLGSPWPPLVTCLWLACFPLVFLFHPIYFIFFFSSIRLILTGKFFLYHSNHSLSFCTPPSPAPLPIRQELSVSDTKD
jgi:hypothetical protein